MINRIIEALRKECIDAYRITEVKKETAERFFVKKQLVMRRKNEKHSATLELFRDFEKDGRAMRGSTSVNIHPNMSEEEICAVIKQGYYAALFVCNPHFSLATPEKSELIKDESSLADLTTEQICEKMSSALFSADVRNDSFINSAEVFAERSITRIVTYTGTDVSFESCNVNGEYVVQCTEPQDVEMYHSFEYNELACDALKEQAAQALETVCDRAKATVPPAAGEYDVILSGKHVAEIMSYYLSRATANSIYARYSNYSIGTDVQGEDTCGERLNITVRSPEPFSPEGIRMPERKLLSDGKLELIHGSTRFCRYLDIKPTGNYHCIRLENGTVPFEQLKSGKCLHVVTFSDFQCDPFTGFFGGEIRLAYLIEDGKFTPVTGGSVNGRLLDVAKNFAFSTERYSQTSYEGPFAVRLKNVSVAGC